MGSRRVSARLIYELLNLIFSTEEDTAENDEQAKVFKYPICDPSVYNNE